MQRARDAPGDGVVVGDAHDEAALVLHQGSIKLGRSFRIGSGGEKRGKGPATSLVKPRSGAEARPAVRARSGAGTGGLRDASSRPRPLPSMARPARLQQAVQRQRTVLVDLQPAARGQLFEGADQAQRGAAQAEGVAFAGGGQAAGPDADQRFDARSVMNSVAAVRVSLRAPARRRRFWYCVRRASYDGWRVRRSPAA